MATTHPQDPTPPRAAPGSVSWDSDLDCQAAAELLPWLVNGSLDGEELGKLHEHLGGCEACRRELADTGTAARIFSQHVPSLALAEYSQGLTPGDLDGTLIEAHVASCQSCREELELARSALQVVDLAAERAERRARVRPAAADRRRTLPVSGRRLGWAAGLAAASLGVLLLWGWGYSPDGLGGAMPGSDVAERTPSGGDDTDASDVELFSDGFDSGSLLTWSGRQEAAAASGPRRLSARAADVEFGDGFESGNLASWSRSVGSVGAADSSTRSGGAV